MASTVLVVDDDKSVRALFTQLLGADGYNVRTASNGHEALEAVPLHRPDVVVLDVQMPGGPDGLEVCRQLKSNPATRFTPVVVVTALSQVTDRIRGIDAGADDFLTKPVHPLELRARVRSLAKLKQCIDELDSAAAAFVSLALTIEARDETTNGHCERLAEYAVALGNALELGTEDLEALHRGGYLHDVGKVGVPDALLLKPGKLTPDEFELMKRHPDIGDTLCAPLQSLRLVRPIIRHHHERVDGSGYPCGLKGDDVPVLAQIVGICDVYDALTSDRPYRPALSDAEAVEWLLKDVQAGKFSRRFVEAFLDVTATRRGIVAEPVVS